MKRTSVKPLHMRDVRRTVHTMTVQLLHTLFLWAGALLAALTASTAIGLLVGRFCGLNDRCMERDNQ